MKRKLRRAIFFFPGASVQFDDTGVYVWVDTWVDTRMTPVIWNGKRGSWRPCVTHCLELIRLAEGKETARPRTEVAKKAKRRKLRIVK